MADKKEVQAGVAVKQEETVKIKLFRDDGRYVAPLFVGVNGRSYLIERGVEVEIPKSVHEVILNSEEQKNVASAVNAATQEVELIG